MSFTRGAIIGMVAGTIVGAMNRDGIVGMFNKGQREMRKVRRKYGM